MKRILVTGGTGFIGSHTCVELLRRKYEVYVIDSFVNSSKFVVSNIKDTLSKYYRIKDFKLEVFQGDLRDKNFLEDLFLKFYKSGRIFDGIIHFAGLKSVNESVNSPIKYWNNNMIGTINLLDVMEKYDCNVFVFSSSATVYSISSDKKLNESSNLKPINPYGTTKLVIEMFLKDVYSSEKNKWKISNLRYFNPIGAHISGLLGESPLGKPNNIFPLIMDAASGNIEKLEVFGQDWPTYDGTAIRDYIHVMDVAEAHIRILEYLFKEENTFFSLNIGTGIGTSVLDLIKTFEGVNNIKLPYVFSNRREGDSAQVVADNSELKLRLNWAPTKNLTDMCKDGWNWKEKNSKLKNFY